MSTYFTDFEEYTTGVAPSDWSFPAAANDTWTVETTGSDKYLYLNDPDSLQHIEWDDIDADAERQDAEVLFLWRRGSTNANKPGCFVRFTGNSSAFSAYRVGGSSASFAIYKAESATGYTLVTSASFTTSDATDYWVRLRVNGTSITASMWTGAVGDEPSTPTLSTTDSGVAGDGSVGLACPSANAGTYQFWQFGVGTNGDTAPTSGAPAGPPTLTGISASGITSSGATLTITAS